MPILIGEDLRDAKSHQALVFTTGEVMEAVRPWPTCSSPPPLMATPLAVATTDGANISESIFEPSTITHGKADTKRDAVVRDSEVALVPRTDTVRCIEKRAQALQGWRRDLYIERLRTQRYRAGGHYAHHFDWGASVAGWARISSIMAWVDARDGLEGGGTEFPLLDPRGAAGRQWCRFIDCPDDDAAQESDFGPGRSNGTVFKPVPGNALYWENFAPDGSGYELTWHAGLPVIQGVKVGLNIWSYGRIA